MRNSILLLALVMSALAFTASCTLPFSDTEDETTVTADSFEPDDTSGSATSLAESSSGATQTPQVHTLHTSSDVDWLTLTVTDNTGNLVVDITPVSGGVGIDNVDFVLLDATLTEVLVSESAFGNSTESNTLTSYSVGTYYVRVYAPTGDTGDYKISWYRF